MLDEKRRTNMKIGITATSSADLPIETLKELDIDIIHFHIEKNGETFFDNDYSVKELFEFTNKTKIMCHTAAPNIAEYEEFFAKELEKYDEIIHITMSKALSSCYDNACFVAKDNPRIKIIDSLSSGGGTALLVKYAVKLKNAGYTSDEIYELVTKRVPFASTSLVIKDMNYLYRGGRCSGVKYLFSKLLNLRPEIQTNEHGQLVVGKIYRGNSNKCIKKYVEDRLNKYEKIDKTEAIINASTYDDSFIEELTAYLYEKGFKKVSFNPSSPTNSYHAGPEVIGVMFLFDGEHEIINKH